MVEKVVPLHHIVSIFRSICNNENVPFLTLPSNFILDDPACFDLFLGDMKYKFHEEHFAHHLVTKFILLFHHHPTCIQFLLLPHNSLFLFQLAKENYLPDSILFQQLRTMNRLLCITNNSKVVDDQWIKEKGWNAAFIHPRRVYSEAFSIKIFIPDDKRLIDSIIENKELLLFLLNVFVSQGKKMCSELIHCLLIHPKWREYKTDAKIQIVVSEYIKYFSSEEQMQYRDIVFVAVKLDEHALQHANDALKGDKEIVLAAVKKKGNALCYVSDKLKEDKEVVLAAVKSCE